MFKLFLLSISLIFLAIFPGHLNAQQKYEKESRLKEKDVPSAAIEFIDSIGTGENIKWYLEEGLNRTSIEAKFKLNDKNYSIEFDTLGNLEDAEIQIKWDDIQKSVRDSISSQLNHDCEKLKIRKVQTQYSGDLKSILSSLRNNKENNHVVIRYELVVKCNANGNVSLFEYLFSSEGQKISSSQIVFKNSSNLEY